MILILSHQHDKSTTSVIEWIEHYKLKWFRINSNDLIDIIYEGSDIILKVKNQKVKLSEIKSFWYRKGYFFINYDSYSSIPQFQNLQKEEMDKFIHFIYYKLKKKNRSLNSVLTSDVNKLIVSDIARDLNILTPTDMIFSNKSSLNDLTGHNEIITKVVSGNCMQNFEDFTIYNYTKKLKRESVQSDYFFPSLVQNLIPKKYELRIFYLDGVFYSMAILSQNDNQTSIDFRNYNFEKPNRSVPYKLPNEIEVKLRLLMEKMDLNSGSIDMIVTPENHFVFLEINPVGQFGMVSTPCNYNLEKEIANYLNYESKGN